MKLFEPGKIGRLTLKNRIVMAAMGTGLVDLDGSLSRRGIDYYVARARGGTGLIITCAARPRQVDPLPCAPFGDKLVIDSKVYRRWLSELAEEVHDYGAGVAIQVTAGQGRIVNVEVLRAGGAVTPSPLPASIDRQFIIRAPETEEVERLAQSFQYLAEVVRGAGIDAIEINAHSGYLTDEFMTSLWNQRTDRYGGDLDGRLRFLVETVGYIKKGAGADFPVIVKYPLTHYLAGGRDVAEGIEIARKLEAAGVDALDIDAGCTDPAALYWEYPPNTLPAGALVDLAAQVKKVVRIPVIAVGKLNYPELAEKVLAEGKADFIALARGLLAEPEWANKVRSGRAQDICPCIGDFWGCLSRVGEGKSISCTVNPECGQERELAITPAARKKSVLVVGGGPAGMEAARIAALRGHRVTLYEKDDRLGGNLVPASVPDFKDDYRSLIDYLSAQVTGLGVKVKLGTEVTPELVAKMKPEVVFIATGSTPVLPNIPGADKSHVATAIDVLLGRKKAGKSVMVMGGGCIGAEVALHLARSGKKVTIVEMLDGVALDMYSANRSHILKLFADTGVQIMTRTTVSAITDEGAVITDKNGQQDVIPADTVVVAAGARPNQSLGETLKDRVPELYTIGDCVQPRKVINAIREGFRAARLC